MTQRDRSGSPKRRNVRTPSRPDSVFINAPFDAKYEPLFLALIAGIVAFGRRPRCVLELPASIGRLRRLMDVINSCGASFHDLSRVQSSRTPQYGLIPRFNMPFELGLAMVPALEEKHSVYILEEVPRRLHATTSDLSMFDPLIHAGTVDGVLSCVLDALGRTGTKQPSIEDLRTLSLRLKQEMRKTKARHRKNTIYSASLFAESIGVATALADDLGLLD